MNGTDVYKKLGLSVTLKYQSAYYWQSFLINGTVPSFFNADCMLHYTFSRGMDLKLGASNVLNHYYYSILGGPQPGGFYYTTLTFSLK